MEQKNIIKEGICRSYQKGDEFQILNLFEKVFSRKISIDFWKWRFIENPFGEGIIKLLFDRDLLVGHYVVIPMVMKIKNNLHRAVFAMTVMTHPDYRGQGIFTHLAKETYKEASKKGFDLVYGFPNKNVYQGYIGRLEWMIFGKMTMLYNKLRKDYSDCFFKNNDIQKVKIFDDSVDLLWNKIKENYQVIIPRTKTFLNWRFIKNPDVNYEIYSVKDGKEMLGYVVLKKYKKNNEEIGHIVDILAADNDIVEILLSISYNYFLENNIHNISCWMQSSYFYNEILEKEGFLRNYPEVETYFGVKILNINSGSLKEVENFNNWYLTMGDSDVF